MHGASLRKTSQEGLRVAVVWDRSALRRERILSGVCRLAELVPHLTLRVFDAVHPRFDKTVLPQVRAWKPHGFLIHFGDLSRLQKLRRTMPSAPVVATCAMPEGAVELVVAASKDEVHRLIAEHFRRQGVRTAALFCASDPKVADVLTPSFKQHFADGIVFSHPLPDEALREAPAPRDFPRVVSWLRALPKPVGILTVETGVAPYLVGFCGAVGIPVPEAVQLIGVDDADDCMGCTPHASAVEFPAEQIGEAAMEALMTLMQGGAPRPPPVIRVEGAVVIPRGSTGPVDMGSNRVSKAIAMIRAEATRGLSAERLVRLSKLGSTNTFYKRFRQSTGTTPARALRRARLDEACRLLVETRASITSIAASCGFSSANYFAQIFHRELGVTARQYRVAKGTHATSA